MLRLLNCKIKEKLTIFFYGSGGKVQIKNQVTRLNVDRMHLFTLGLTVLFISKTSSDNSIAVALYFNILRIPWKVLNTDLWIPPQSF